METDEDSQTFFRQADARVVIPRESARFCKGISPLQRFVWPTQPRGRPSSDT